MKRIAAIIILVCAILCVVILVAAGKSDGKVSLTDIKISDSDGTVTFIVRNDSDKDIYFEPVYTVQKRSFLSWREIENKQDYNVPTHYYTCEAGSETSYTLPWPLKYSSVDPGNYRMAIAYGYSNPPEKMYTMHREFELK